MPWWGKILIKLVLARLPVSYSTWAKLGIFRHGSMEDSAYAETVFNDHLAEADLPIRGTCMEIGPGDSAFTAVNASKAGFAKLILLDAGNFARQDLAGIKSAALTAGMAPNRVHAWRTYAAALEDLGAIYLTGGLSSLKMVAEGSVNFVFSQAVLEHIRKAEYPEFIAETFRVLRRGGRCSHSVDLKDHLGGKLNNLRFPHGLWEAGWFASSGFYTNRLSVDQHMEAFHTAGFEIEKLKLRAFDSIPIPRARLAAPFRNREDEDLMTSGFRVVAVKP